MNKELYEIPKIGVAKEEPFSTLSENEWLGVIQHIFAHTVKGEHLLGPFGYKYKPSRKNRIELLNHTREHYSEEETLASVLTTYLRDNGALVSTPGKACPFPEDIRNIPEYEYGLYRKAAKLYSELYEKHSDSVGGFL